MLNRITPTVRNLLIANVLIYFIGDNLPEEVFYGNLAFFDPFLANSPEPLNPNFKPWQIISHMFLHSGTPHLFSNMFGLFMFGPALETYMGSKKFFTYYVLCGIGAVILQGAFNYYEMSQLIVDSPPYLAAAKSRMVGASGAIFGILGAFGFLFPNIEMMLLFFPFPIKAKYFVALYGLYELVQGAAGFENGIAHFAHLGGLITGLILLKFLNFQKQKGLY